jgi:hypothetical protein
MQTSPRRHSEPEQGRPLQHGCTQLLLPAPFSTQKHCFLVFLHRLKHLAPRRGHVGGAASAGLANQAIPAVPNRNAPASFSDRRREMVLLANPLAKSSKERSTLVLFPRDPRRANFAFLNSKSNLSSWSVDSWRTSENSRYAKFIPKPISWLPPAADSTKERKTTQTTPFKNVLIRAPPL